MVKLIGIGPVQAEQGQLPGQRVGGIAGQPFGAGTVLNKVKAKPGAATQRQLLPVSSAHLGSKEHLPAGALQCRLGIARITRRHPIDPALAIHLKQANFIDVIRFLQRPLKQQPHLLRRTAWHHKHLAEGWNRRDLRRRRPGGFHGAEEHHRSFGVDHQGGLQQQITPRGDGPGREQGWNRGQGPDGSANSLVGSRG